MSSSSTSRIAKNTLLLYFRQILIMLVSLYTVRVVLNVLGAEDYGIYNVVAGVVTMFGFLSGAMATASQRYFAFDLGKEDYEHLKTTFSVTFQIYVLLAAIIVVLAETIGLWFVMNKLVIPPERLTAAIWIYQAAVFAFIMKFVAMPYMASVIAHENMNVYAYVGIAEVSLNLVIVFILQGFDYDKLILYGCLLALVSLVCTIIYRIYCKKHYTECKFVYIKDKALFKELVSYSGWNLFGSLSGIFKRQGVNIILNLYFGALVNAAYSIALQVSHATSTFAQNFVTAMRPPIIKKYAAEQYDETKRMVFSGCKFVFYLVFIFALPLALEMDIVLNIWLKKEVSETMVTMTRLSVVEVLILSMSFLIMALAQATKKIKKYQSVVGGILLLNLPISWVVLECGFPAYSVVIVAVLVEAIAMLARVSIVGKLTFFTVKEFLVKVAVPCAIVIITSSLIPIYYHCYEDENIFRLCMATVISVLTTLISVLTIGVTKTEREFIFNKAKNFVSKIKKK